MILSFSKKQRVATTPAAVSAATDPASARGLDSSVVRDLAQQASGIGREAAEMLGFIDEMGAAAKNQADAFSSVLGEVRQIVAANQSISASISATLDSAATARAAVERVATDVSGAADTLREVADAAAQITKIALQTRLVAFNASVEAKRAGEAGRGFAVVADAVKDLSQKVETSSQQIAATVALLDRRIGELTRTIRADDTRVDQQSFHGAFARVESAVGDIWRAAGANVQSGTAALESVSGLAAVIARTATAIDAAKGKAVNFLSASEDLLEMSAECGAETADSPFIRAVLAAAADIGRVFEEAIQRGEIALADLFDERYQPIAGSNPQQLMTRFVAFTDRVLPAIQEPMLALSDQVVFCAAVDRNGFLPTHNNKFSRPQGADPVWNAANCRNRRIFNDRTGLAAGRNTRKFLLQTYRRDMGGGNFALMKDLSAPITVRGRHWGGLRLAYRF